MQGSINFDGSLVGNITGGGGGGGSEVVITPVLTSGTKIADVTVDGENKDLFAPTPTPPTPATEVSVTQTLASGTKIGSITINNVTTDLYAPNPTAVSADPIGSTGDNIGSITINGTAYSFYAPYQSAVNTSYDNTISKLTADDVQEAIDEISGITGDGQLDIGNNLSDGVNQLKQSLSQLDGLLIYKDLTPTDDYAEFNDGSNLSLISLISNIEPIQSGSGTPSPDNPRSISGHTDIDIIVSPNSDFSGGSTYSVNFVDGGNPLTVYGGTLDVVSGVLTVDRVSVDLGTLSWSYSTPDVRFFTTNIIDIKKVMDPSMAMNGLCSHYNIVPYGYVHGSSALDYVMGLFSISTTNYLAIKDTRYTDATSFRTAMNGVQLVYELQTPQTYQLTHTEVHSLLGQNYISSDAGNITNIKYLGVLNLS